MTPKLLVFALNRDVPVRHTNLSRAQGEVADLPPLAEWLGVDAVDPHEIELFPVRDLDGMSLADYVTAAFAPEAEIEGATRARLDALDGSVLLVPEDAITGSPAPGPEATQVAEIALARPDNSMEMDKIEVHPSQPTAPEPAGDYTTAPKRGAGALWLVAGVLLLGLILWVLL